jgi:DNA-binding transcriptional MerR regulator
LIIAKKIGLTVDAIRFYERNSLLPRPPRTEGGFRKYGESDAETLGFIPTVRRKGRARTSSTHRLEAGHEAV